MQRATPFYWKFEKQFDALAEWWAYISSAVCILTVPFAIGAIVAEELVAFVIILSIPVFWVVLLTVGTIALILSDCVYPAPDLAKTWRSLPKSDRKKLKPLAKSVISSRSSWDQFVRFESAIEKLAAERRQESALDLESPLRSLEEYLKELRTSRQMIKEILEEIS